MTYNHGAGGDLRLMASGRLVSVTNLRVEDVDVLDIARNLSNTCRWSGATSRHYSVAQHSWLVARIVDPRDSRRALLHDAAEYLLGDMPGPLKHESELGEVYRRLEARVEPVIREALGVPEDPYADERVKIADVEVLYAEANELLPPHPWHDGRGKSWLRAEVRHRVWTPERAYWAFLTAYDYLTRMEARLVR